MKAWRKHNSTKFVRQNPQFKIQKYERRYWFKNEHAEPSLLLLGLLSKFNYGN